ncbi:MAG: hypothetical protein U0894_05790 [Pirellulales bacterium]
MTSDDASLQQAAIRLAAAEGEGVASKLKPFLPSLKPVLLCSVPPLMG